MDQSTKTLSISQGLTEQRSRTHAHGRGCGVPVPRLSTCTLHAHPLTGQQNRSSLITEGEDPEASFFSKILEAKPHYCPPLHFQPSDAFLTPPLITK